jgi:hypothetical protein
MVYLELVDFVPEATPVPAARAPATAAAAES